MNTHSKSWMERHENDFNLTEEDLQFIRDNMTKAAELPEGRDKTILLAEISARVQNKIPTSSGKSLRALQRISMLLNPKTNIRNVAGNIVMVPQHIVSDIIGSAVDRAVSAKTGVRTTGAGSKGTVKGFAKGVYESWDDFRRKIDTRNIGPGEGRFDIAGQGPSFNNDTRLGRALNGLDRITSFALDMGDRPFFEMWFVRSPFHIV